MPFKALSFTGWPPLLRMLAMAAVGLCATACAETGIPTSSMLGVGAKLPAPVGYLDFCRRRPEQCDLGAPMTPDSQLALTSAFTLTAGAAATPRPASVGPPALSVMSPVTGEPALSWTMSEPSFPTSTISATKAPISPVETAVEIDLTILPPVELAGLFQDAPEGAFVTEGLNNLSHTSSQGAPLAADLDPPSVLVMTPELWSRLTAVDRDINQKIRPATDVQAFGVDNFWDLPLGPKGRALGNCKHYALEKRRALVDAGLPSRALSLAIVRTHWGEVHAVLLVTTDKGEYVLDNLSPWVTPWRDAGYVWLARQTPGKPLEWAMPDPQDDTKVSRVFDIASIR